MNNKRGLSPVIATILLVAIVVILGAIIFLWARSFFGERVEKFEMSEDQACEKVALKAEYTSGDLDIINEGDVALYGFKVEKIKKGESERLDEFSSEKIDEGASVTVEVSVSSGAYTQLKIIPILLGKSKGIKKTFVCDEKYGTDVYV